MYRCVVLLSLLFLTLLPTGQSALVEEADVQHLSCVADNDCRLTTYPIGEETVGGQVQGTPFAPAEVVLEFIIDPAQDVLVLLPSVLDHVELDLRLDDDPTRLSWPTLDLRLVHGDGVTQWSLAPSMEGTGPAYVDDDVALELDGRRVLWPGDDVRLLIGFSLDRPATWSLHLRGASSIEMNIVWSADPEAADVDEPSSRLEPVETEFEMAHDGALVGDDVDCYTFEVEAHEVLRVLMEWDLVPIELQQQSARPELILADGREAPTPEMQVVQDEERASVRYVWRALREGDTTLCLQGQADRFQAYVWAGMLSYEGIGPVDPGGFSGEGTYPEGGGQAPPAGEPMVLAEPTSGVAAVGGVALLLLGLLDFTRRTTSVLLRFGVTVPGLLLVLTAGVVHPLVAASSSVQQPGELTLEEVIDDRLAQLWDVAAPGIPESTMVLHAGATFGRLDGEVLRLRLDVTDAVPLEDGRFQLQAKGLDSLRLDEAIFGHVARAGGASSEHVQRFVLLAGAFAVARSADAGSPARGRRRAPKQRGSPQPCHDVHVTNRFGDRSSVGDEAERHPIQCVVRASERTPPGTHRRLPVRLRSRLAGHSFCSCRRPSRLGPPTARGCARFRRFAGAAWVDLAHRHRAGRGRMDDGGKAPPPRKGTGADHVWVSLGVLSGFFRLFGNFVHFLIADAKRLLERAQFFHLLFGDHAVFPCLLVGIEQEVTVRVGVQQHVSDQPMVRRSAGALFKHGHRTANLLHGHVLQAMPNPHQSSGRDRGCKPLHGVRIHEVAGAEHVEEAEQHHGRTRHHLNPVVDVGLVIKDGEAFVDGVHVCCGHGSH